MSAAIVPDQTKAVTRSPVAPATMQSPQRLSQDGPARVVAAPDAFVAKPATLEHGAIWWNRTVLILFCYRMMFLQNRFPILPIML